jgi:nascent polypeptide-associated complex subunit beta
VQEVNIFKDDNTVLHFKKPILEYSFKEKVSFLTGPHDQKHIRDLLPSLIKQLGPKQFSFMKEYAEQLKGKDKKGEKIEEAPELVEDFEEVSKQEDKKPEPAENK